MRIYVDFPGANGTGFRTIFPDRIQFSADPKGGPYAMWFHFRVESPGCAALICEMINGHQCLGWPYRSLVRPVFKIDEGEWQRAGASEVDAEGGIFRFQIPCRGRTVEVAYCYPYRQEDWDRFIGSYTFRKISLGRTEGGRELWAWQAGEGEQKILLTARGHAGETPGSFVAEGMIRELLSRPYRSFQIIVLPFLDLDAVAEGMYGKDRPPVDFYMGWSKDISRPEIGLYKNFLRSIGGNFIVAVDCHSPAPNDPHYFDCSIISGASEELSGRMNYLGRAFINECDRDPGTVICRELSTPHPGWFLPGGFENSLPGYIQKTFAIPAITLETAYHMTHAGAVVGPEEWQRQGKALARTVFSI